MILTTEHLTFECNENGSRAVFQIPEKPQTPAENADFWRLIFDDGMRTEIPILSHQQSGSVRMEGGALIAEYDGLLSEYGDRYDVLFRVTVTVGDGLFHFTPYIENHTSDVRINECFCPLADFTSLVGEKKEDAAFMPNGLGTRVPDPWSFLRNMTGTYYAHDDKEVFWHYHYPRATMGWFGIQSGDRFLYVARYDEKMRHCFLTMHQRIHAEPTNITVGIDHFPMARPGECLTIPSTCIGLLAGDWREGAKTYRAWADRTFFRVVKKADWVKNMTGWQRIIMRSQYGEDYYKAEDLVRAYKEGAKHGIHTIFLFAWWKEGMDRNYPTYNEPYPGAFEELKKAFRDIQRLGGRVILECNCHFMDPKNDFYREHGEDVRLLDINGNEVRPAFVYAGRGEFRQTYGARQFPLACSGTELWREQVLSQLRQMKELGADCLFTDCFGGCPYQPCFNDRHEHGARVDEEWVYHRKFFEKAVDYCEENDRVLGTEVVTDIASAYAQFIHGLVNVDFQLRGYAFPQLFRYTFPEVITTERGIRDEEGDFAKRMKCALVTGVRLDAELYVCRADLSRSPKYAAAVDFYTDKLKTYSEFFFDGKFTVIDTSAIPALCRRGEFYDAEGRRVLRVLYNASNEEQTACGVTLGADEMRFDIFDAESYGK